MQEIREVLDTGWVTQGPKTEEFELAFSSFQGSKFALATTSCTAALHLALLALNIGAGDEVIVPSFTWVTTAHSVEYVGARPIFADIDIKTFNLDPNEVESRITKNTRAIIVVHLFGKAAPMKELLEIAENHNLRLIEDCACAIGTKFNGVAVGSLGDVGCFSFHPRKIISTGEGGMVTTESIELSNRISILRNHGASPNFVNNSAPHTMANFEHLGYNLRLSDIQAAVGVAQMKKLPKLLSERRDKALLYAELLRDNERIMLPTDDPGHTYQSFVVIVRNAFEEERNSIMSELFSYGIQTRPGTHSVPHLGYYKNRYKYNLSDYPNSIYAQNFSITLPNYSQLSSNDQERICEIIHSSLNKVKY